MRMGPLHAICHRLSALDLTTRTIDEGRGYLASFEIRIANFEFGIFPGQSMHSNSKFEIRNLDQFHRHTAHTALDPNVDFGAVIGAAVSVGMALPIEGRRIDVGQETSV